MNELARADVIRYVEKTDEKGEDAVIVKKCFTKKKRYTIGYFNVSI